MEEHGTSIRTGLIPAMKASGHNRAKLSLNEKYLYRAGFLKQRHRLRQIRIPGTLLQLESIAVDLPDWRTSERQGKGELRSQLDN